MEKRKLPFDILDSIRGIAALYVAIAHCRANLWIGGTEFLQMFPRSGWSASDYIMVYSSMLTRLAVEFVIVFFVLSGFSIAHSLSSNKSALQFYKRRFIRIYPSYLVALTWAGLVFVITKYWHPGWYDGHLTKFAFIRTNEMNGYFDGTTILKNLFYMPSQGFITPFWSLTYEVIFYILAPFLLRRVNWYAGISAIFFLVNLIIPAKIQSLGLPLYIYEFLFVYNIFFAAGVTLYKYLGLINQRFDVLSKKGLVAIMFVLVLLMYFFNLYNGRETQLSFLISAALGVMLIVFFLKFQLRIKWLIGVGKYSYTLYITHFASVYLYLGIYWLIVKPDVPYILNYFVWMPAVLFVVCIAYLQYLFVEKRTKNVLNILRRRGAEKSSIKLSENAVAIQTISRN